MIKKIIILAVLLSGGICLHTSTAGKKSEENSYALQRGIEAMENKDTDGAINWFNQEINHNPTSPVGYYLLHAAYADKEDYAQALSALKEVLRLTPRKNRKLYSSALFSRAQILLLTKDTLKALDDMSEAIHLQPNLSFYESRGNLYYELGKYDLSDADYKKTVDLDPGSIQARIGMGRNAIAEKRWDDAITELDYATRLDASFPDTYLFRAEACIGKKEWIKAADDIIKALSINPDPKVGDLMAGMPASGKDILKSKLKIQMIKEPENCVWPYAAAAVRHYDNDYQGAIELYEKANSLNPNPDCLRLIAECCRRMRKYVTALEYVNKADDMEPDKANSTALKADILHSMGRNQEALQIISEYINANPESVDGYFNRSNILMNMGKYGEAAEDISTALILPPPAELIPVAYLRRGDAYRMNGEPEKANRDYHEIIRLEAGKPLDRNNLLPYAESGLGECEKAEEHMKTIIENDSVEKNGCRYNLACIYVRCRQPEKGIALLEDVLREEPEKINGMSTDYDLIPLKGMEAYNALLARYPAPENSSDNISDINDQYIVEVVEVPFTKENGVTKVKCTINELPLHFVFDTGAADVTISMVEANFMLKNEYIKKNDIVGSARYVDANGDVSEGTVINLRKVNFGGLELDNVRASVVRNQRAPLLLGQSVLGRLGKIEIDNANSHLKISHRVKKQ